MKSPQSSKGKAKNTFFTYYNTDLPLFPFPRTKSNLVQLCKNYNDVPKSKLKNPQDYCVSKKYDGVYCFAYVRKNTVHIFSRTGEEYLSLDHLKESFMELSDVSSCDIFIFEAYVPNTVQSNISGMCRDKKKQYPQVIAMLHDSLTLDEFCGDCVSPPFVERWGELCVAYSQSLSNSNIIKLVNHYTYATHESIDRFYKFIISQGGEGIILRERDACYHPGKRDETLLKLKAGITCDLQVIGFEEGTKRLKGTLGSLVCRYKDGKTVKVGTGFSDAERRHIWENQLDYLGTVIEVAAMSESSLGLLREPRFKGVREDKECADY